MNLSRGLFYLSLVLLGVFLGTMYIKLSKAGEPDQQNQKIDARIENRLVVDRQKTLIPYGKKDAQAGAGSVESGADSVTANKVWDALENKDYVKLLAMLDEIESKFSKVLDSLKTEDLDIIYYLGYANHTAAMNLLMRLFQNAQSKRLRLAIIHALVSEKIKDLPNVDISGTPTIYNLEASRHAFFNSFGGLWPPSTTTRVSKDVKIFLINSLATERDTEIRAVILYGLLQTINEQDKDLLMLIDQVRHYNTDEDDYLKNISFKAAPELFMNKFLNYDARTKKILINRLTENIRENVNKEASLSFASYILRYEPDIQLKKSLIFRLNTKDEQSQFLLQGHASYETNEEVLAFLASCFHDTGNLQFVQYLFNKVKDPENKRKIYNLMEALRTRSD